jgi:hypothetical protein
MGLRSVRRPPGRPTSQLLGIPFLALLFLGAALIADAPSSDPRLSVIYTVDDEGLPLERPELRPDSAPQAVAVEGPDLDSHRPVVWSAAATPAIRLVQVAALGGHAPRAPPRS